MKLALAMIVKGSDEEANILSRCLENVSPHVEGIFITSTYLPGEKPNEKVREVAEFFNAHVSEFEWQYDFSAARNFNFSQVPKEYTHILWADADDMFRGLEKLEPTLKENPNVDCFSMFYLYDWDEHKRPTVVHQKTMVVKNDGCVEWAGALHEDFKEHRSLRRMFLKGIERLHLTDEKRIEQSRQRNVEVAEKDMEDNPDDPRSYWNLGAALFSAGRKEKALETLERFMEMSHSEDEKYIALLRIAAIQNALDEPVKAKDTLQRAIGMKPEYPDAYHHLGGHYFNLKQYEKARDTFLLGLTKKPPIYSIIAYNPRDYDYNPMMFLAKTFLFLNRPDSALIFLEACHKIYPQDDGVKKLVDDMKEEAQQFERALEWVKEMEGKTGDELKALLDEVPEDLRSHPQICFIRNRNFIKQESSGKDLVIYCGPTTHEWNPELFKTKGFGGSEEAVIHLSKRLADKGLNVTVYANCGYKPQTHGNVTWKPYWEWNYRDKQDYVILWRSPKACDYPINSEKIYVDVHDAIQPGEFTEERLKRITKIFVKTQFHRSLFPNVSDNMFAIIPNGIDLSLFSEKVKRDPYLLVNTSSPDRSLDVLPKLFKQVKKKVPKARCVWAYGWDVFDAVHGDDEKAMEWKKKVKREMREAGIEELGKITQTECGTLYQKARIFAYPSEFAEIDCISVKKAQAAGCIPVTTDFAALAESTQFGFKAHSEKTKDNWCKPYQISFGLEDPKAQQEWVKACVNILREPVTKTSEMQKWARQFDWDAIAEKWYNELVC